MKWYKHKITTLKLHAIIPRIRNYNKKLYHAMLYIIYIFFLKKTKDRVVMIGTHLEKLIVPKPEPVTIKRC